MRRVVFVGPSVPAELLSEHFDGEVRRPVGRGDLDALVESDCPPGAVGIIDGRFLQDLAVTPKEILRALDAGVAVFGSSSMGALRAVECAPYGMIPIGRVAELYATGEIDSDDEVAIAYDPESSRALSVPMVNIRIAMAEAAASGVLPAAVTDRVVAVAKELYFPERTYRNVGRLLGDELDPHDRSAYEAFVSGPDLPDQKHTDGVALLQALTQARSSTSSDGDR